MVNISIMSQALDLGTINFVRHCVKNNFRIRYLLFAPEVNLHPLRLKQNEIRTKVFGSSKSLSIFERLRQGSRKNRLVTGIKTILCKIILFFYQVKYGFSVRLLDQNFYSSDTCCYESLTVVYSLEGILAPEAIKKFKIGILNIHPAILPDFRGLDGGLWALKEGSQLGVSAYLVDKGIDTGPIVSTYSLKRSDCNGLEDYIKNLKKLKYASYVDAINLAAIGKLRCRRPIIKRSQNRGLMDEKVLSDLLDSYRSGL